MSNTIDVSEEIRLKIDQYINDEEVKAKPCICRLVEVANHKIVYQLMDFDEYKFVVGFLTQSKFFKYCNVTIENGICTFDIPDLSECVGSFEKKKWNIGLAVEKEGCVEILRFKSEGQNTIKEQTILKTKYMDDTIVFNLYCTKIGNFAIRQLRLETFFNEQICIEMTKLSVKKGILSCTVQIPKTDKNWSGFYLVFRARSRGDRKKFFIPATKRIETEKGITMSMEARLDDYELTPLYWDIKLGFDIEGETFLISTKCDSIVFEKKFSNLFDNQMMKLRSGLVFFPYIKKKEAIAFLCRTKSEYDGFGTRVKERIAKKIYLWNKSKLQAKNIYLVYEKYCELAQDNGYYFFKYCMDHNIEKEMGKEIYYIIDKRFPDYKNLKPYRKNVLKFMSLKHMVYMLAAKAFVSSEFSNHAYAWEPYQSVIRPIVEKKKLVFLQHGVIAFKKLSRIFAKNGNYHCNLFIASGDFEKDIIVRHLGYDEEEVAVTGLARWDVLHDCSQGRRDIILMPTWRNWLESVNAEDFIQSDYYQHYMAFINSDRLAKLLDEKDFNLIFYIHPKFKEFLSNFKCKSTRVRIVQVGEEPLNQLLMQSKLLITDYSSVAWDMFYQGKPVLFYQFDIDYYNEAQGSYIDMETELFGERAMEADELLDLISLSIERDFKLNQKYEALKHKYFKYIDDNNCRRICELIERRIG